MKDVTMRVRTHSLPTTLQKLNWAKLQPFKLLTSIHIRKKALLINCPGQLVMIVSGGEPGYMRALQLERENFPKGGDRS